MSSSPTLSASPAAQMALNLPKRRSRAIRSLGAGQIAERQQIVPEEVAGHSRLGRNQLESVSGHPRRPL